MLASRETNADGWPDDVRLSGIETQFVCKSYGKRGADVRPDFASCSMQAPPLPPLSTALVPELTPAADIKLNA